MLFRDLVVAAALSLEFVTPALSGTRDGIAAFERGDYSTAQREFSSVAAHNDADAQYLLGHMYHLGLGVAQDDTKAFRRFNKAAKSGGRRIT